MNCQILFPGKIKKSIISLSLLALTSEWLMLNLIKGCHCGVLPTHTSESITNSPDGQAPRL